MLSHFDLEGFLFVAIVYFYQTIANVASTLLDDVYIIYLFARGEVWEDYHKIPPRSFATYKGWFLDTQP
ncbi:hypothetical protein BU16DRAFT_190313 [Lophium mytilinum]|uniref:Uncharacterized protein n=1 Tax=Lophium mytilinum TaxID=390894 RepID=A0A6A6R8Y3_9PEZI|nr:hypothetical protein BU16DRAFT_190313 [Lophium mytilinum]